ncbi:rhomboid-domain-containing protein [Xylariaceae sp. FL1651]|nr:rhomboid-domain-containing protein [Xylariaceae sp. FL1651]
MFRARARKPLGFRTSNSRTFKRSFGADYQPLPQVRLLGPALWSFAACSTIYLGCVTYEVYQDVQHAKAKGIRSTYKSGPRTFEELERTSNRVVGRSTYGQSERPEFSAPQKLTAGVMALTAGVHVASNAVPGLMNYLMHVPAVPNNYTLLTSVFGHSGLIHLGMNLYGMWWLMPSAARSPTFKESNAHLTAFYLSAGILSSLAQHATTIWPRRMDRFIPSLGASGALFAMLGVIGMSYPNTHVGILFLPGSWPITQALAGIAIFDAVGIFYRYPYVSLGHAAHLGGLAIGVAYVKYGGDKKIWRPCRRLAFNSMRSLGAI